METERIESMLTQLINMVGSLRSGHEEMKSDIQYLRDEL